jgi:hypothetical protein
MAKQVQLTDGRTALFDDGEPLENIDRKLKDAGLERVKGGTVAKIMEPVMEGTSALLGFPGAAQQALGRAGAFTAENLIKLFGGEVPAGLQEAAQPELQLPTPRDVRATLEQTGIPTERAETIPGRVAQSTVRNLLMAPIRPAMIPGMISAAGEEAAAFPFRDTPLEPTARLAGAIVAPAATGAVMGRTSPQVIAREEMAEVTPAELAAARVLQQESRLAGSPVTAAEAVQRSTGEARGLAAGGTTRLPELQRMIEASRGGGAVMRPFLAEREDLAAQALQRLASERARPSLGMDVQAAAQQAQREAAQAVSRRVGPEFRRLEGMEIPQADFDAIVKDNALVKSVYNSVKSKPEWKQASKNFKENSVGFVELMRQELGDRMTKATREGQNNKARVLSQAYDDLKLVADDAVGGDYQAALTATREARREIQQPLESTPIARVAETTQTPQQFAAIFAKDAQRLNLTPDKVKTTVGAFAKQDPLLAREFVAQYLRSEMDKIPAATQRELRKGARFADTVFGNETQRQNLLAAYETAYGKDARIGFDRFLRGLKTQAERLPVGSPTAEKGAMQERGVSRVRETVGRPLSALADVADFVVSGRDMEKFARALTSPNGVDELARLAAAPVSKAQVGASAVVIQRLLSEQE